MGGGGRLNDKKWKEFLISDLFDIQSTSSGIDKNKLNSQRGQIPYITRTDINNGINFFVEDKQNTRYKKDCGNVITIGLDTQTVFYQKHSFYTGQNIQVLRANKLNEKMAQFIIPLLKIQMQKFNWGGNGATLTRLNKTKILLPINAKGKPDYQFMSDYMQLVECKRLEKYFRYRKI